MPGRLPDYLGDDLGDAGGFRDDPGLVAAATELQPPDADLGPSRLDLGYPPLPDHEALGHACVWRTTSVQHIQRPVLFAVPIHVTLALQRCGECGTARVLELHGEWTVAQVNGDDDPAGTA